MSAPLAPGWQQPSANGQLSSSATPTFKTRYQNARGATDPAGQMRLQVSRTGSAATGPSQTPTSVWDTGWLGAPTVTSLPLSLANFGCAYINDRIYITGGVDSGATVRSDVWSAPAVGGSIGTWRAELPMSTFWPANASASVLAPRYAHGCTAATFGATGGLGSVSRGSGGQSWLVVSGGVDGVTAAPSGYTMAAPILSDGTLGPWVTLSSNAVPIAYGRLLAVPNQYVTAGLLQVGGVNAANTVVSEGYGFAVKSAPNNGQNWLPGATVLPGLAVAGHTVAYDWANGVALLFRGSDGGANQLGEYYLKCSIDIVNWVFNYTGGWTACTGAFNASNNAALVYIPSISANGASYAYIFGGSTSVNINTSGTYLPTALSSIQYATVAWSAGVPTFTWANSGASLPAAATTNGAVLAEHAPDLAYARNVEPDKSRIYTFGGGNGSNSTLATTCSTTRALPGTAGDIAALVGGTGAGLATGDLGSGGSVATVSNPEGAQDATLVYNAVQATATTLVNGDVIQAAAQFTDKTGGDYSPVAYRTFTVGQVPVISAVSPANASTVTNGLPTISFAVAAGAGAGMEYSWQVTVKQGATLLFDSGLRYDQANSVAVQMWPMLPPSQGTGTYTLTIVVTSTDLDPTGVPVSATSTTTFGTSAFTTASAPTSPSATPDSVNGRIALAWTGTSSYARIYHRRTGSGAPFTILADNVAGTSYTAMDHIAPGIGYDFQISLVNATPGESALSSTVAGTIAIGNWTHYLHVATLGTTYATPLQVQGSPDITLRQDTKTFLPFNQGAPVGRSGQAQYHLVSFSGILFDPTPALLQALQAIMRQVQLGQVVCLRDALGGQITAIFDGDQGLKVTPPYFRTPALKLTEVADNVGPMVTNGSAQGSPVYASGRRLPLSTDESLL